MKVSLFILSFFLSFTPNVIGQNKYKFQYRVETKKQIDTGYVYLESKKEADSLLSLNGKIIYQVKGCSLVAVIGFYSGKKSGYIYVDSTDRFHLKLIPAIYKIVFGTIGLRFLSDTLNLEHPGTQKILFTIDRTIHNPFLVHAKRALSKEEIERIKHCLEENRDVDKCKQKDLYYLEIEI